MNKMLFKNTVKHILSVMLVLGGVAVLSILNPVVARAETQNIKVGDNVTAVFDSEARTLTLSGTGPTYDYNPSNQSLKDLPTKSVDSIIINNGVTHIGDYLFEFIPAVYNATEIIMADSVVTVGDCAFYWGDNSAIETIKFSNNLTEIGEKAFRGHKNANITSLPDSITKLDDYAFYCCGRMTLSKLPDSVEFIGSFALDDMRTDELSIPSSLKHLDPFAFNNFGFISKFTFNNVTLDSDYEFRDASAGNSNILHDFYDVNNSYTPINTLKADVTYNMTLIYEYHTVKYYNTFGTELLHKEIVVHQKPAKYSNPDVSGWASDERSNSATATVDLRSVIRDMSVYAVRDSYEICYYSSDGSELLHTEYVKVDNPVATYSNPDVDGWSYAVNNAVADASDFLSNVTYDGNVYAILNENSPIHINDFMLSNEDNNNVKMFAWWDWYDVNSCINFQQWYWSDELWNDIYNNGATAYFVNGDPVTENEYNEAESNGTDWTATLQKKNLYILTNVHEYNFYDRFREYGNRVFSFDVVESNLESGKIISNVTKEQAYTMMDDMLQPYYTRTGDYLTFVEIPVIFDNDEAGNPLRFKILYKYANDITENSFVFDENNHATIDESWESGLAHIYGFGLGQFEEGDHTVIIDVDGLRDTTYEFTVPTGHGSNSHGSNSGGSTDPNPPHSSLITTFYVDSDNTLRVGIRSGCVDEIHFEIDGAHVVPYQRQDTYYYDDDGNRVPDGGAMFRFNNLSIGHHVLKAMTDSEWVEQPFDIVDYSASSLGSLQIGSNTVESLDGSFVVYDFTPEETGYYHIYTDCYKNNGLDSCVTFIDATSGESRTYDDSDLDEDGEDYDIDSVVILNAGQKYYLKFIVVDDTTSFTYDFHIEKSNGPTDPTEFTEDGNKNIPVDVVVTGSYKITLPARLGMDDFTTMENDTYGAHSVLSIPMTVDMLGCKNQRLNIAVNPSDFSGSKNTAKLVNGSLSDDIDDIENSNMMPIRTSIASKYTSFIDETTQNVGFYYNDDSIYDGKAKDFSVYIDDGGGFSGIWMNEQSLKFKSVPLILTDGQIVDESALWGDTYYGHKRIKIEDLAPDTYHADINVTWSLSNLPSDIVK